MVVSRPALNLAGQLGQVLRDLQLKAELQELKVELRERHFKHQLQDLKQAVNQLVHVMASMFDATMLWCDDSASANHPASAVEDFERDVREL